MRGKIHNHKDPDTHRRLSDQLPPIRFQPVQLPAFPHPDRIVQHHRVPRDLRPCWNTAADAGKPVPSFSWRRPSVHRHPGVAPHPRYKGFGVFLSISQSSTQLWIAFRYLTAFTFLVARFSFKRRLDVPKNACCLHPGHDLPYRVDLPDQFPDCFIEGKGLTRFK